MSHWIRPVAFVLLVCVAAPARADTWAEPKTVKVPSANGKYTALVVPRPLGRREAKDADKPIVHVYEGEPGAGGKWSTLWKVKLTNDVAPVETHLSNDSRLLVTLDEWHNVGGGENVVAFYAAPAAGGGKEGRQLARYSLDQIMSRQEIQKVRMSVSSTWWREHGRTFLDESGAGTFLCVWLGVCGRWAVWDASTGKPVEVDKADPALRRRWDEARSKRAAEGTRRSAVTSRASPARRG